MAKKDNGKTRNNTRASKPYPTPRRARASQSKIDDIDNVSFSFIGGCDVTNTSETTHTHIKETLGQ